MRWFIGIFIAVAVAFIAACEEESAVWGGDSYYGKGNGYDWTANAAGIPEKKPPLDACSVEEVNLWILDTM